MLKDLDSQIKTAMKAKDALRVSTFRMLKSALHNAKIEKGADLTEQEEIKIAKKEAKKRKDSIEAYKKAGREELAQKEQKELEILQEFLPKQMSAEEMEKVIVDAIDQTGAEGPRDMGKVIAYVMKNVGDKVDGSTVSKITKAKLSG